MFGVEDFAQKIVDFENFDIAQLGTAAAFGGAIMLIGMATIFAVLCIIWICITLFKVFFHDLPAKKAAKASEPAPVAVSAEPVKSNADEEIVAVIAAAIAMAESENSGMKFKVVSFKRK